MLPSAGLRLGGAAQATLGDYERLYWRAAGHRGYSAASGLWHFPNWDLGTRTRAGRGRPTRDLCAVVVRSTKLVERVEQTAALQQHQRVSPEFYFIFPPVFHRIGDVSKQ